MIELLSPAGNLEKLKIALLYGADAVYVGGRDYSLRANAKNFSREELKEASIYAHKLGKKIYVTVNIIFHNEDTNGLEEYLKYLSDIKIDAVIVSDIYVINLINKLNVIINSVNNISNASLNNNLQNSQNLSQFNDNNINNEILMVKLNDTNKKIEELKKSLVIKDEIIKTFNSDIIDKLNNLGSKIENNNNNNSISNDNNIINDFKKINEELKSKKQELEKKNSELEKEKQNLLSEINNLKNENYNQKLNFYH